MQKLRSNHHQSDHDAAKLNIALIHFPQGKDLNKGDWQLPRANTKHGNAPASLPTDGLTANALQECFIARNVMLSMLPMQKLMICLAHNSVFRNFILHASLACTNSVQK